MDETIRFGIRIESDGDDLQQDLDLLRADLIEAGADVIEVSGGPSRAGVKGLPPPEIVVAVVAGSLHVIIPTMLERLPRRKGRVEITAPDGAKVEVHGLSKERLGEVLAQVLTPPTNANARPSS